MDMSCCLFIIFISQGCLNSIHAELQVKDVISSLNGLIESILGQVELADFTANILSQVTGEGDHPCQLLGIPLDELQVRAHAMKCNHLVLYSTLLLQEGIQLFLHDFLKGKDEVFCDLSSPSGQPLITDKPRAHI